MGIIKSIFIKIIILNIVMFLILGATMAVETKALWTEKERDYISKGKIIKAASIDGGAPLHYKDSKGEIRGIAVSVLEEISDMTGLKFEYALYESTVEAFESDADILFGVTTNYAPSGMVLSRPYLKSRTILYINSSLDSTKLDDKIYAGLKGGRLPEGIKEENTIYYNSREETLDAVEKGWADYSYGNEYSIAFYLMQKDYKNIVTIPQGKEIREYCIGFPNKDDILLSIINKSIDAIDESTMQTLILEATSEIERDITLPMVISTYGIRIFAVSILIITVLSLSVILNIRTNNRLRMQNEKNKILSQISNEYLYEYHIDDDNLVLCKKCTSLFGKGQKAMEAINILKETLLKEDGRDNNRHTIKLPLADGSIGIFRIINTPIYDRKGKINSIIGKLIDISKEVEEKEELITKAQMDGLTGLYNAITTKELIEKRLKDKKDDELDAFIIIDCDKFKKVNDTFGHLVGNIVLENVSKALRLTFRQTDVIGRIGGDEFCVYMMDIPSADFVCSKSLRLGEMIKEKNKDFYFSTSIGIALSNEADSYEGLFKKADIALYDAKRKNGGKVIIHS